MARTRTEKHAIISGAGWIGSLAGMLIARLEEQGWSPEDIHGLINEIRPETPEFDSMVEAMIQSAIPKSATVIEVAAEDITQNENVVPGTYVLTFEPLLEKDEDSVSREVMFERSKRKNAKAGMSLANALLRQQDKIPVELLNKASLIFAEGVSMTSHRLMWIPRLVSHTGKWLLLNEWFDLEQRVGYYDESKNFYRPPSRF